MYIIYGKRSTDSDFQICGVYTSHPLATAHLNWHLKRSYPDAEFKIIRSES